MPMDWEKFGMFYALTLYFALSVFLVWQAFEWGEFQQEILVMLGQSWGLILAFYFGMKAKEAK